MYQTLQSRHPFTTLPLLLILLALAFSFSIVSITNTKWVQSPYLSGGPIVHPAAWYSRGPFGQCIVIHTGGEHPTSTCEARRTCDQGGVFIDPAYVCQQVDFWAGWLVTGAVFAGLSMLCGWGLGRADIGIITSGKSTNAARLPFRRLEKGISFWTATFAFFSVLFLAVGTLFLLQLLTNDVRWDGDSIAHGTADPESTRYAHWTWKTPGVAYAFLSWLFGVVALVMLYSNFVILASLSTKPNSWLFPIALQPAELRGYSDKTSVLMRPPKPPYEDISRGSSSVDGPTSISILMWSRGQASVAGSEGRTTEKRSVRCLFESDDAFANAFFTGLSDNRVPTVNTITGSLNWNAINAELGVGEEAIGILIGVGTNFVGGGEALLVWGFGEHQRREGIGCGRRGAVEEIHFLQEAVVKCILNGSPHEIFVSLAMISYGERTINESLGPIAVDGEES
ncbi:uncharacterized protein N7477_003563 [Penicillium maclennaniae]|uniref:uncharacterized protein n=1 Tax=Penicillium maclennaniae TaxID=1343394 RepID=UPI0025415552|nr:uncharacterized protein N7477_003563 [Penicillium maclennaniae]KAJ5677930.1 hypothetical protein N7477_003563 [Penicillium maclennaniae]